VRKGQEMTDPTEDRGFWRGGGAATGVLFFGFGGAAGVLVAVIGAGFLQASALLIVTVLASAAVAVALLGLLIFVLRRRLWQGLLGYAEVQIDSLASPLAKVAERAIERDPAGATAAARDLAAMALSRYSWYATRRWFIAALTALIAARIS